jgi:hypothetical protein
VRSSLLPVEVTMNKAPRSCLTRLQSLSLLTYPLCLELIDDHCEQAPVDHVSVCGRTWTVHLL